jgi:hypothetical protein
VRVALSKLLSHPIIRPGRWRHEVAHPSDAMREAPENRVALGVGPTMPGEKGERAKLRVDGGHGRTLLKRTRRWEDIRRLLLLLVVADLLLAGTGGGGRRGRTLASAWRKDPTGLRHRLGVCDGLRGLELGAHLGCGRRQSELQAKLARAIANKTTVAQSERGMDASDGDEDFIAQSDVDRPTS